MSNTKWADFAITKQHKAVNRNYIQSLIVREDHGDSLGVATTLTKNEVIRMIKNGKSFVTAPPNPENPNNYVKGQPVRVITVNGVEYLRTDSNSISNDNLGNLPEF